MEVWLLRLAPPGQSFDLPGWFIYSAAGDAAPVNTAGQVLRHNAGLTDVEVVEKVDLTDGAATGDHSARVTAYLIPDPSRLVQDNWRLSGWMAELSLWSQGTTYESREIVFRGTVDGSPAAGHGQAVEFTILPPRLELGAVFPPTNAFIETGDTWDSPQTDGAGYTWVFGSPGDFRRTSGAASYTSASRAYVVDTTPGSQLVLLAGHRCKATSVKLFSAPENDYVDFAVTSQQDGRGRWCAVADVSSEDGVWTLDDNAEIYVVQWNEGGLPSPYGPGLLTRAGDVLYYILSQQRANLLDAASWKSALPILNRRRLDGVWPEPGLPWDWAQEQLLPLLPAVWVLAGPFGARPILLDETDPSVQPATRIGQDLYRPAGGLPMDQGTVSMVSRATVSYAARVRYDKLMGRAVVSWSRRQSEVAGTGESATAQAAASMVGDVEQAFDATALYSRSEAFAVAGSAIELYGRTATTNELWGQLGQRSRYPLGRGIRLTDDEFNYVARPSFVTGRRLTLSRIELTLTDLR